MGATLKRLLFGVGFLGALACAPQARADGLSVDEQSRLATGATVVREQTVEDDERRLVGGVTYTVVEATPEELEATFIEVSQGNNVVSASYVLQVRKYARERTVRFWLAPTYPHAIDDAWGFFRAEPLPPAPDGTPRTLLTYGVLVDVGPGIVRAFYEEKLRAAMLAVPQLVRQYVQRSFRSPRPA